MQVWTVVNQKGGVGKTTSAASLAGSLISQGYKVLLLDLDPHASLSYYFKVEQNSSPNLYDYFLSEADTDVSKLVKQTRHTALDVLPAIGSMATLDRQLGQAEGKGLVIKNLLAHVKKQYDVVIIDCPPVLGVLMVNGLMACNTVIIPTQTEYLAIRGLNKMLQTLDLLAPMMTEKPVIKIVATMFDRRLKACQQAYKALRQEFKSLLWQGYIPTDTKFREASQKGLAICDLDATSRGSFAYEKLCNDLLKERRQ
ncbi:ParA family protein [Agaribacter flavus]|uniref:ParA family protein n=1 Tax=Agaribacter flavus TaxID=1902781 RepID=A0ABV7FJS5_9ALTE